MIDIANCAAGSISGDSLKRITINEIGSAGYHNINNTLAIFLNNIEAEYIYAVHIEDDGTFTISIDPTMESIDEFGAAIETTEALVSASKGVAAAEDYTTTDNWGTFYSAYSPVFDSNGEVAGIIGVDFPKEWYDDQVREQYTKILISFMIILCISMPIIVAMCLFTIRTITNPINQLTEIASKYQKGDFSQPIQVYEEEKMGILSNALQSMSSSLTEQITKAEEASKAKSNFLANMSHEIRTPINAVLGMNEMILRESTEPEIRSYSENIKSAGMTLLNIINDILDFSKIEAGKMEITAVEYDLLTVLNDLVNMIRPRLDAKKLELKLDFNPDIPKKLYGDSKSLKQIITNILTNAAKYTEEGSVTFTMSFKKPENDPDSIVLLVSIKDTGIGIKPEDIKKLFSEFERIEEKRNRNIEGTGLGMSITKSLLGMMGSTLEVESTYGEGSNFHFALKQEVRGTELLGDFSTQHLPANSKENFYKEKFTAPMARILVVDDNPMNLLVFKNLIKQTLIDTDTASSGDEALAMMRDKKYDIIFLDHMMPNKDGIATLHELKLDDDNPNLNSPVVCLTANAISGVREQYISAGFDDYLTKPIKTDVLEDMLIKYLPSDLVELTKDTTENAKNGSITTTLPLSEELSSLQDQDLIDSKAGIANSGDEKCFLSMLEIFSNNADTSLADLNRFYSGEDFENYTIKIHALKSSSRIIGALGLADDAQNLENAGKAGDYDIIRKNHNDYEQKFRQVTELVRQLLNKQNQSKTIQPVASSILVDEAFAQIKKAAQDMDYDTLEAVYKEMSEYTISENVAPLWNQVLDAFHAINYEKIIDLLSSY
ncbi:ATP-binding protein [Butyrivibrio sp. YAB3001]|uniref:ATP-binding protein n=1 Tax=Butyrivibrio sp. YAB3001 TaxID=1520812 RepID=UPI001587FCAF|nr:ATP-binding protein [Butyrivibrio sp. YAB3001]